MTRLLLKLSRTLSSAPDFFANFLSVSAFLCTFPLCQRQDSTKENLGADTKRFSWFWLKTIYRLVMVPLTN